MKRTIIFFAAILLLAVGATAQKLSYQAVVRNDANELVTGTTVQVTVSILNATGDVQYAENHANVQTNLNGLLSLMIGDGTPTGTTTMADVVWTGSSVRTVITLPSGASVTSVTPVNAVPYALYADNVNPANISQIPENVSAFENDAMYVTNSQCENVDICTLAALLTQLQEQVSKQQHIIDSLLAADSDTNNNSGEETNSNSCPETPIVKDVDGNVYHTVQIGNQCWMNENLRTTHYSNGDTILLGNARKYPNNNQSNIAEYGYLYQWYATMHLDNSYQGQTLDTQGICPAGWHVPSYAEWGVLADYAGQNYWGLIALTGFSTQLAGRYWDGYHNFGERNYFWTRDYVVNQSVAYRFMDDAMNLSSNAETENAYAFFSVRCLRDENSGGDTPGGNTPSIPVGDAQPCPGTPTVTDHEGNVYNTVQIGDQCWTKENMRCTTSPKGYLSLGGTASTSATSPYVVSTDTAYYYNWDNLDIPLVDRGMYYNWAGAMDTTAETHITVSFTGRRGICPEGWHVPSYEEWNTLTSYVGNQSAYQCNTSNAYVAKALASTNYWNTSSNPCAVGNESVTNNTTGLSIVPAGYFYFESFFNQHAHANMWSSTSYSGEEAAYRTLTDGAADVNQNGNYKSNGRSVRCLRD